jgi:hypothetical protein
LGESSLYAKETMQNASLSNAKASPFLSQLILVPKIGQGVNYILERFVYKDYNKDTKEY